MFCNPRWLWVLASQRIRKICRCLLNERHAHSSRSTWPTRHTHTLLWSSFRFSFRWFIFSILKASHFMRIFWSPFSRSLLLVADRQMSDGAHIANNAADSRAASRTPARVILSVEGEIARPCATDQQLVGVGQGVCVLNRKGAYDAGQGASRGRKPWMIGGAAAAHAACKGRLNCCRV